MIIPVRCFSCGKVIGNKYNTYKKFINEDNISSEEALIKLNVTRYCCRRMIISHVDLIDKILQYDDVNIKR